MKYILHNPKRDTNPAKDKIFCNISQILILTEDDIENWGEKNWKHFNTARITVILIPKKYEDNSFFEEYKNSVCYKTIKYYITNANYIFY